MARNSKSIILILVGIGIISSSFIFCKRQGIEGQVLWISGNQMPSPDKKPSQGRGIKTTLYIYQLTNLDQVDRMGQSTFYSKIRNKLVKKIETKENGSFKVKLSPGHYSLFLMKDTLFYANRFDDKNNIAPVEVVRNKMTKIDLKMDYSATY
jgi:hypothetical protein